MKRFRSATIGRLILIGAALTLTLISALAYVYVMKQNEIAVNEELIRYVRVWNRTVGLDLYTREYDKLSVDRDAVAMTLSSHAPDWSIPIDDYGAQFSNFFAPEIIIAFSPDYVDSWEIRDHQNPLIRPSTIIIKIEKSQYWVIFFESQGTSAAKYLESFESMETTVPWLSRAIVVFRPTEPGFPQLRADADIREILMQRRLQLESANER